MRRTDLRDPAGGADGYWFVPHAFGIGATPVTWQGWALSFGFAAMLWLDIRFLQERIGQLGVAIALAVLFTVIAIRKTRGGWGWRWGRSDER